MGDSDQVEKNVFPKTRYILPFLIGLGLLLYGILWWVSPYLSENTYWLAEYSTYLVYVAVVLIILKTKKINLFKSKADVRSILKTCVLMILALVFALGSIALFSLLLPEIYEDEGFDVLVKFDPFYLGFAGFLSMVLLAPFWEELVFRGLVLHRWIKRWNAPRAIVLSSLLFAFFHPLDIIGAFFFGLILAIQYLKTRNILIAIMGHSFYNGLLFLFFLTDYLWFNDVAENVEEPTARGILIFSLISIMLSLPFLIYWLKKNWPKAT